MAEWKVGDQIVVRSNRMMSLRTITRVLARFVEDSDGGKWGHDGMRYPMDRFHYAHMERATLEHVDSINRDRRVADMRGLLATVDASKLSDEAIDELTAMIARLTAEGVKANG